LQKAQKMTQNAAGEIRGRELDCVSNGTAKWFGFQCKVEVCATNGQS
jgi:hypothetical protein